MHALADTWSHQGFSGALDARNWKVVSLAPRAIVGIPFPVGHAPVLTIPDMPFWGPERAEQAGETLFAELDAIARSLGHHPAYAWEELKPRVRRVFETRSFSDDARSTAWISEFGRELGMPYAPVDAIQRWGTRFENAAQQQRLVVFETPRSSTALLGPTHGLQYIPPISRTIQ
jgi:hypothetical protein